MNKGKAHLKTRHDKTAAPNSAALGSPRVAKTKRCRSLPAQEGVVAPLTTFETSTKVIPLLSSAKSSQDVAMNMAVLPKYERLLARARCQNLEIIKNMERIIASDTIGPNEEAIFYSLLGVIQPLSEFLSCNIQLRNQMMDAEFKEMSALQRQSSTSCFGKLMIQDASWVTPMENTEIDIGSMRSAIWKFCTTVAPNFRAIIQIKPDRNEDCEIIVRWWVDVIFWGGDTHSAEAAISNFERRFKSPSMGNPAIRLRWLEDNPAKLAREIARSWKLKLVPALRGKGKGKESSTQRQEISAANFHLFRLHSLIQLNKTMVTGGQGKAVKNTVFQKGKEMLEVIRIGPIPVHPEGLLHFWAERITQTEDRRFRLPLVTYRHPKQPPT
jgi:hypothetical protein